MARWARAKVRRKCAQGAYRAAASRCGGVSGGQACGKLQERSGKGRETGTRSSEDGMQHGRAGAGGNCRGEGEESAGIGDMDAADGKLSLSGGVQAAWRADALFDTECRARDFGSVGFFGGDATHEVSG